MSAPQTDRAAPDIFDTEAAWAGASNDQHPVTDPAEAALHAMIDGERVRVDEGLTDEHVDLRNAERLVERHADDLRYVIEWGTWIGWDGKRWSASGSVSVMEHAKETARALLAYARDAYRDASQKFTAASAKLIEEPGDAAKQALEEAKIVVAAAKADLAWAVKSQSESKLNSMIALARTDPEVGVSFTKLDADPWLLNVENGTIDLKTGTLRPHRREDHITRLAPVAYDPDARCPTFDAFIMRTQNDDAAQVVFMQYFAGYCLTGSAREHMLSFWYGTGGNGKGVLGNLMLRLLGDYADKGAPDLLFTTDKGRHPTELADLHGKRLVICNETKRGRAWDESRLCDITSEDPIKARRMNEDFWSFIPTHKLVVWGNHKPRFHGSPDPAIERRLRLVPFEVTIPKAERDTALGDKLWTERSGILRWAVDGCLDWLKNGMPEPPSVTKATSDYLKSEDSSGTYLDAHTVADADARVDRKTLRAAYVAWCEERDERPCSAKELAQVLRQRGVKECRVKINGKAREGWRGLRFKSEAEQEAAEPGQQLTLESDG